MSMPPLSRGFPQPGSSVSPHPLSPWLRSPPPLINGGLIIWTVDIEFVLITVWLTTPGPGTPSTVCQPCSLTRPRAPGGNFTSTTWTWTWVLRKWRNVLCVLVLIVQWCGCLGLGGPGDGEAYRLHQPQVKWPRKYLYSILENVSRIDPAPLQLVEKCSLQKVHSQFSLLGMKIWKYIFYIFISEAWEVPMWRLLVDWLEL